MTYFAACFAKIFPIVFASKFGKVQNDMYDGQRVVVQRAAEYLLIELKMEVALWPCLPLNEEIGLAKIRTLGTKICITSARKVKASLRLSTISAQIIHPAKPCDMIISLTLYWVCHNIL